MEHLLAHFSTLQSTLNIIERAGRHFEELFVSHMRLLLLERFRGNLLLNLLKVYSVVAFVERDGPLDYLVARVLTFVNFTFENGHLLLLQLEFFLRVERGYREIVSLFLHLPPCFFFFALFCCWNSALRFSKITCSVYFWPPIMPYIYFFTAASFFGDFSSPREVSS